MVYEGNHRLGELFRSRREKGKPGLPTVSVTLTNGLVDRESLERKTDTNLSEDEHLLVKKGDIAYNMMRMWQGACGLAEKDGIVSPAYVVLAPKKNVDSRYAAYLFKSQRLIYLFWAYSYGLTADRLRLYFDDFARIPVNIPNVKEQEQIAKILSTWDKTISVTEKLIVNAKAQKRALMQQLLTGSERLPGFNGAWRHVTIKNMGRVLSGGTPDTENPSFWDGDIIWITPTDITALRSQYISDSKRKITDLGLKSSSANLIPAGAVLVCTRATVGELAIARHELTTNQGFKSLVPNQNFDGDFVYYIFQFYKNEFIKYACGSTFLELSKKDFERRSFYVPDLREQQAIAHVLNNIMRETWGLEDFAEKLRTEKKALMQQLLTGKRRVKLDSVA